MSNSILTREQYEFLINQYVELEYLRLKDLPAPSNLGPTTFFKPDATEPIDSSLFLECDDDWGLPLPFGWIAQEEYFTGEPDQGYYTDYIIEVKYD